MNKDQLKIVDVQTKLTEAPLKRPFVTHLHQVTAIRAVQVQVTLQNGMVGVGAATPNEQVTGDTIASLKEIAESVIAPELIGLSLGHLEPLMGRLNSVIRYNEPAKAAFDIAIYDLQSQISGLPLTALLGGAKHAMATDYTISIGPQSQMVNEARQLVKDGFTALKVKIGNQPVQKDVATVRAIADAVGPQVALRLDVNQGWNYKKALLGIKMLADANLNISFLEQPLPAADLSELAKLRTESTLQIMLDESVFSPADALRVIEAGAADLVNIKLMKSGGLYNATIINQLCATAGIPCMVGCMIEAEESLAAALAFANAHENVHFIDLDSCFMAKEDQLTKIKHQGPKLWL